MQPEKQPIAYLSPAYLFSACLALFPPRHFFTFRCFSLFNVDINGVLACFLPCQRVEMRCLSCEREKKKCWLEQGSYLSYSVQY